MTQATGRPISRFTVVAQKTARWWSVLHDACTVCTFNACPSEKGVLCGAGKTGWRDNEWGQYSLHMRGRFSLR
ncbi:hypothetical protein TNCV_3221401 [Trichonephila clavipes]|nr:hypothetical protein TNCV_3221401 [Trichonephila clavipes]